MAQPTGLTTRYAVNAAIREDLEDIIYDITPMDTYFFSNLDRVRVNSTLHEWQTDSLATVNADNAAIEGDDMSAAAATDTTRYKNYSQISRKELVVSGTLDAVKKAGKGTELAYQMVKKGKELKRDIEAALLQNKAATAGAAASARVSASVETWIFNTQHIKASGQTTATTPAPSSGIAGTAPTDGSATALTEADFKTALQVAWTNGGEINDVFVGASLKDKINAFTGIATRFRDVGSRQQAQIIGAADVYVSSFGSHNIRLSRYMRSTTVLFLDMNYWALGWLRSIGTEQIAKTGDSEKRLMLGEWTLICKNPLASTKLGNVT